MRNINLQGHHQATTCNTIVFTGSTSNPNIRSAIYVEDYFTLSSSAYTIYRTGYDSGSDGTIVSTAPAETS